MTIHYVTPVYYDGHPDEHYALEPWVQPMKGLAIDTRGGYARSEPVVLDVPEGSTVRETERGLAVTRLDGAVSYSNTWPPPVDGRVKPTRWIHSEPAAAGVPVGGVAE